MKKLLVVVIISLFAFIGCNHNDVAEIFNPLIGTWTNTTLGVTTTLTLNAGDDFTETVEILGIGSTQTGTWTSNDETMTRLYSDDSTTLRYYTFNANETEMTLSSAPGGLSTTYTK